MRGAEPKGKYITVVARLQAAADGRWYVYIDGTNTTQAIPLAPVALVVRLWRASETGLLRGIIRLHGSDHWAPIQSNDRLEELVRAWLLSGAPGNQ
jgi:hypothetical protein